MQGRFLSAFRKTNPNIFSLVSVGFEKCLPDFLVERDSYPEIGRSNAEHRIYNHRIYNGRKRKAQFGRHLPSSYAQVLYLATKSETIIKYQALQSHQ